MVRYSKVKYKERYANIVFSKTTQIMENIEIIGYQASKH